MDKIGGRLAKQHKTGECCVDIFSEKHLQHDTLDKTVSKQHSHDWWLVPCYHYHPTATDHTQPDLSFKCLLNVNMYVHGYVRPQCPFNVIHTYLFTCAAWWVQTIQLSVILVSISVTSIQSTLWDGVIKVSTNNHHEPMSSFPTLSLKRLHNQERSFFAFPAQPFQA